MRKPILVILALIAGISVANDGGLASGGSPRLLNSHPSIRMESELILIKIRDGKVTTKCQFTFVNTGKACDVVMGFPDKGFGEKDNFGQSGEYWKDWKVASVFDAFSYWVNGKQSKTSLIKGKVAGEVFQAKKVQFGAKATVKVRDVYVMNEGGTVTDMGRTTARCTGYILATGASWKGNIGSTTVVIEFDPAKPMKEMKYGTEKQFENFNFVKEFKDPLSAVRCRGPVKPVLANNKLTFSIKNWRPTKSSDIYLEYHSDIGQE